MNSKHCAAVILICATCASDVIAAGGTPEQSATSYSQTEFAKARTLSREGKYREAAAEYDAMALKNQGEDEPAKSSRLDALYWAAMCYIDASEWSEAKRRFEKIIASGESDKPIIGGFPSGFRRMIVAYEGLSEAATKEKDYKRALSYAEAARKKLNDRLASIEKKTKAHKASPADLELRKWILAMKPLFDWKIAHPEQIETYYYSTRTQPPPASAPTTKEGEETTAAASCGCGNVAVMRRAGPLRIPVQSGCGCGATSATATASCCTVGDATTTSRPLGVTERYQPVRP